MILQKPNLKKERNKRKAELARRRKKFRVDVHEANPGGQCERQKCTETATSTHHIEKRDVHRPELDLRENGIELCAADHNKVENGNRVTGFSGEEIMLIILQPYMTPGTIKHLQWHGAYEKLKEKVKNKRLSGKI